ncbi:MAG: hypothetical protein M3T49_09595 [Candidatus Eremiobacteraeota bacterium]|nr:hypothetical protein [Candidatus Eremiobacteraeota bacterium]
MVDALSEDGELQPDGEPEYAVQVPPNARIRTLSFAPGTGSLRVFFSDGDSERVVVPGDVLALHGASIASQTLSRSPKQSSTQPLATLGMMAATGMPVNPAKLADKLFGADQVRVAEELHYVMGLRVAGQAGLWYLRASSFNFRQSLGEEATYSTEINLRRLGRRLRAFAPDAVCDSFMTAFPNRLALPPPLGGLIDFLRVGARSA